ncbi:MAG TPA: hypothetical protein VHJ78_12800 [Actinomycetota bacterium]|nr:hypothetical protein [Actinomycetota bacterium]
MLLLGALGLAAIVAFFYLRAQGNPQAGDSSSASSDLARSYTDLCRVRTLAETDVEGAANLFFGRVHSPLHVIAAEAQNRDRAVAAGMLEAKNDVETAFNQRRPAAAVTTALDRLLATTAQALRSIGVTSSTCEAR